MVDTRFHTFVGPIALLQLLGGTEAEGVVADSLDTLVEGAEELATAGPGHIALAAHHSYRQDLKQTSAGVVIVSPALLEDVPPHSLAIPSTSAHMLFVDLLERLYPQGTRNVMTALMGPHDDLPRVEADVRIGPGVVLGPGVEIGRGTVIGPNTVIGAGVTIGRNTLIGSNCSIECTHLGNNVVLHSGSRIGAEGFGWLDHGRSNRKIPQLGRVIVQDRVEVGANSTIDRGALGDTVIGEGTKIDNLVQIGHNCRIGRNCLIAGCTGIAGSTTLEDSVMVGGACNIGGHLTIGFGSVLAGNAMITNDVPPRSQWAGTPATDAREWRRQVAQIRRLGKRT